MKEETYEEVLDNVRTASKPSELKITDMRVADIIGAPMPCCILKLYTNQGLVGYGEVRDFASRNYALSLKSRIVGENPCNIDKIFRRIKQFGGQARQAGGVCGIELALWDLAGKAYEILLMFVKQSFEDFENLENKKESNLNKTCCCRPAVNSYNESGQIYLYNSIARA